MDVAREEHLAKAPPREHGGQHGHDEDGRRGEKVSRLVVAHAHEQDDAERAHEEGDEAQRTETHVDEYSAPSRSRSRRQRRLGFGHVFG